MNYATETQLNVLRIAVQDVITQGLWMKCFLERPINTLISTSRIQTARWPKITLSANIPIERHSDKSHQLYFKLTLSPLAAVLLHQRHRMARTWYLIFLTYQSPSSAQNWCSNWRGSPRAWSWDEHRRRVAQLLNWCNGSLVPWNVLPASKYIFEHWMNCYYNYFDP